jgi:DNA-binding Lrp family transcriptional regulator
MPSKYKPIVLNQKNLLILDFLFINKIATSKEFKNILFQSLSYPTMQRRLRKLVKSGHIQREVHGENLGRALYHYFLGKNGKKHLNLTNDIFKGIKFKSENPSHDLELISIREKIKQMKGVDSVFSENKIIFEIINELDLNLEAFYRLRCDGVIKIKNENNFKYAALEYESSLKSSKRYKKLFRSFYNQKNIHGVFYVCKSKSIKESLIKYENDIHESNRANIFYITLEDFYKNKNHLVFVDRLGGQFKFEVCPKQPVFHLHNKPLLRG